MAKEQLIKYSDKQKVLMRSEADTTLYGGARGGGKTFGIACKMALDICEDYTEAGILDKGHRRDNYRTYMGSDKDRKSVV